MPALTHAQARIVWVGLAAVLLVAVVGALVASAHLPMARGQPIGNLLLIVAAVMVPLDLGASFFVVSRMRKRAVPGATPDALAGTQMIVGCAVALGAGLMCCVFFFISREPLLLALVLPCAAALLYWFPSQRRWDALLPQPAPGQPPRRNPLVRE
jgi:hypothetical protein